MTGAFWKPVKHFACHKENWEIFYLFIVLVRKLARMQWGIKKRKTCQITNLARVNAPKCCQIQAAFFSSYSSLRANRLILTKKNGEKICLSTLTNHGLCILQDLAYICQVRHQFEICKSKRFSRPQFSRGHVLLDFSGSRSVALDRLKTRDTARSLIFSVFNHPCCFLVYFNL